MIKFNQFPSSFASLATTDYEWQRWPTFFYSSCKLFLIKMKFTELKALSGEMRIGCEPEREREREY